MTPTPIVNFLVDLEQETLKENHAEAGRHLHRWGYMGASGSGGCKYLNAHKTAGVPMPPKSELQKETGAMDIGTILHLDAQQKFKQKYDQIPDLTCECEVYVHQRVIEGSKKSFTVENESTIFPEGTLLKDSGVISVSPIDMEVHRGPSEEMIIHKEYHFRNQKEILPFLHPEHMNRIVQIGDIKSASPFAYKLMKAEGLPFKYKAQGHIYMKYTKQKYIDFLIREKTKDRKYIIRLHWQDDIWERVQQNTEDILRLAIEYLTEGNMTTCEDDFKCLTKKGVPWWGCSLATVKTRKGRYGKTQDLVRLCPEGQAHLWKRVKRKYAFNTRWKFGRSIVDVLRFYEIGDMHPNTGKKITTETVEVINTTNRRKKAKDQDYETNFVPATTVYLKFKSLDLEENPPEIPSDQQIFFSQDLPEAKLCPQCTYWEKDQCMIYGGKAHTFPSRPVWCEYGIQHEKIPKEN